MKSSNDIRREFIDFFTARRHTFVPSSSLLPAEDPTLLFANAGMNQFKGIFLGSETRDYVRAANTQKCIRAGGKHNDLEDVGHDCYHHTFFEMLGNWSFGDYFKAEAIQWAWELLTDVWRLPKDRLYATVFGGDASDGLAADEEAERLWREKTDIDPSRILHGGRKDNFWEMGETGPCGPCSEIHMDLTDDGSGGQLVNAGDPRVIEIWNLVFIQFDRDEAGKLSPLPASHVDTGMGFERVAAMLAGKKSNYATDLFVPLIEKIESLCGHRYGTSSGLADRFDVTSEDDPADVACRVIADHARTLTFAIADGVMPSNEGRGYVLRRILRRAARYGRQNLGIEGPFLAGLVPTVVELMGETFPEIRRRQDYVVDTIRGEEESFGRTLDRGIRLFNNQVGLLAEDGKKQIPGHVAFDLYATFGFPVDLTQLMAAERSMTVDTVGFAEWMDRHKQLSSAGAKAFNVHLPPDLPATDDSAKYGGKAISAKVLGWVYEGQLVTDSAAPLPAPRETAVVLDRTNFYAEQGGQVGDTGELRFTGGRCTVSDSQLAGKCVLHQVTVVKGTLRVGDEVRCRVDHSRRATMRNHTATHLLNWALREVLGEHVNQAGSVVAPDRLRFDFAHSQAVTDEQLAEVERIVNGWIVADEPVAAQTLPLAEALKIDGLRAMFGEKYPDPVRVIRVGKGRKLQGRKHPLELCGGTHVGRTGQIGMFKIIGEESVAKGVRRITALTGPVAVAYVQQMAAAASAAAKSLRVKLVELPERIEAMSKEIKELRKAGGKSPAAGGADFTVTATVKTPSGEVLVAQSPTGDAGAMRTYCDVQRQKGAAGVFVGGVDGAKVMLVAMVSDELVGSGKLRAGEWVKAIAPVIGGGGGGKPNLAQAGGKQPEKLPDALAAAADYARERLA